MKLKVKPEGRESVWLIASDDMRAWLDDWFGRNEYLHCIIANDNSSIFAGADWVRESFNASLNDADARWGLVTSDRGVFAGHRLVCISDNNRYVYDVGELTEADLELLA